MLVYLLPRTPPPEVSFFFGMVSHPQTFHPLSVEPFEPRVPQYYCLKRGCTDPETEYILAALRITPILSVIISNPADCNFALKLSNEIMRSLTPEAAHLLAKQVSTGTGKPVLVIGEADFLDAYYHDGTKEAVAIQC